MEARFMRTANVLAGWTKAQPRHPPKPDVAKIIGLLKSAAFVGVDTLLPAVGEVAS